MSLGFAAKRAADADLPAQSCPTAQVPNPKSTLPAVLWRGVDRRFRSEEFSKAARVISWPQHLLYQWRGVFRCSVFGWNPPRLPDTLIAREAAGCAAAKDSDRLPGCRTIATFRKKLWMPLIDSSRRITGESRFASKIIAANPGQRRTHGPFQSRLASLWVGIERGSAGAGRH